MAATETSSAIVDALLAWYACHARRLPWRAAPGEAPPDPYRVWLSEIMLQQTTVAAARPYFERFLARWPDVSSLAAADEAEVMARWAGLGYYARARNLHACAKAVARDHGGRFPENEAELQALPGIGDYTAAAIAAIAYGADAVPADANIERVVTRLCAIATPLPKARSEIRARAADFVPSGRAGDFAQAMMDLGATICTARNPSCAICPVREWCAAARTGDPVRFPVKLAKQARPHRHGTAFWITQGGEVLLIRRPAKGMLGRMRALPSGPWQDDPPGVAGAPIEADWSEAGSVRHVFTHFSLDLRVETAALRERPALDGEWWPIEEIEQAGLPTLFAKAAAVGRASMESSSAALELEQQ